VHGLQIVYPLIALRCLTTRCCVHAETVPLYILQQQQQQQQDGTPQSDRAHGIASAGPGKYVITGDTFGSYAATNKGGWDMVAALLTVTK
jgi:hypothetical protein